ncbi:MAG: class I SAM-dependent methyltransferase [Chitinophagales bacterium]
MTDYFEANKRLWDERTLVHEKSAFYDVDSFKKGINSLTPIELAELTTVKGKRLLHLQCHFGLDTLSWARLGAKVTGIDFSEEAIAAAQKLTEELKMDARFLCSNVYELDKNLEGEFDIIFTSYGVVGWLPDLDRWASIIAHFLTKGGTFYLAEFHPVVWMFDNDFEKIKYPYHNYEVIEEEETGTYANRRAPIKNTSFTWNHGLGEVINALINHRMKIEFLHEFPFSPYNCFQNTIKGTDGNFRIKNLENLIPMMYSIKAIKQ